MDRNEISDAVYSRGFRKITLFYQPFIAAIVEKPNFEASF
jgi:hypothetical protein